MELYDAERCQNVSSWKFEEMYTFYSIFLVPNLI